MRIADAQLGVHGPQRVTERLVDGHGHVGLKTAHVVRADIEILSARAALAEAVRMEIGVAQADARRDPHGPSLQQRSHSLSCRKKTSNYLYVLDLTLITLGWQLMALSRDSSNGFTLMVANFVLIGALQTGAIGLPPFVKLQLGIVRFHLAGTISRCIVMGAAAASTCYLVILWGFDSRVVPLTLIAQAVIALLAATTYRDLRASHFRAAHFVRSLPLSSMVQVRADVPTVATLALPFAAVAPLLLVVHGVLAAHVATAIVFSGAPLLALLRLPQRYVPGKSVLLGAILAAGWIIVAWQIFV